MVVFSSISHSHPLHLISPFPVCSSPLFSFSIARFPLFSFSPPPALCPQSEVLLRAARSSPGMRCCSHNLLFWFCAAFVVHDSSLSHTDHLRF